VASKFRRSDSTARTVLITAVRTAAIELCSLCTQAVVTIECKFVKQAMAKSELQLQLQQYNMRRAEGDIDDNY